MRPLLVVAILCATMLAAGCSDQQPSGKSPTPSSSDPQRNREDDAKYTKPDSDPKPMRAQTTLRDILIGKWQFRLPSGHDELYTFDALGAFNEGTVVHQIYFNGQIDPGQSWTGKYRWWDNPLLGPADRTQLQIGFQDPIGGRKEFKLIVRALTDTALVLESVFNHQQFKFQRVK